MSEMLQREQYAENLVKELFGVGDARELTQEEARAARVLGVAIMDDPEAEEGLRRLAFRRFRDGFHRGRGDASN